MSAGVQRLSLPLAGGGSITIEASRPLTDEEWELFTGIVNMS
jgi:hypothetical protein